MSDSVAAENRNTFLDSIWARLLAALIAAIGILLFVSANYDLLFESGPDLAGAGSEYRQCLDERMEAVEKLAEEAGYTVKQTELARARAEESCRNGLPPQ